MRCLNARRSLRGRPAYAISVPASPMPAPRLRMRASTEACRAAHGGARPTEQTGVGRRPKSLHVGACFLSIAGIRGGRDGLGSRVGPARGSQPRVLAYLDAALRVAAHQRPGDSVGAPEEMLRLRLSVTSRARRCHVGRRQLSVSTPLTGLWNRPMRERGMFLLRLSFGDTQVSWRNAKCEWGARSRLGVCSVGPAYSSCLARSLAGVCHRSRFSSPRNAAYRTRVRQMRALGTWTPAL